MKRMRIWIGAAEGAKYDAALKEIKQYTAAGSTALYIVPEQQTVQSELQFATALPSDAPLYFEVTNFSRLCNRIFRSLGGLAKDYATPVSKALYMWETLHETAPLLQTKPKKETAQISERLSLVRELRQSGISPDMLAEAADGCDDEALADKLRDLGVIYEYYRSALQDVYADSEEDIDEAALLTEGERYFEGWHIYISGFGSFTAQQMRLMSNMADQAEMTVMLSIPCEDGQCSGSVCFDEVRSTLDRLISVAKKAGVEAEISVFDNDSDEIHPAISYLSRSLFSHSTTAPFGGQTDGAVEIVRAEDPYDGAEHIATDIMKRLSGDSSLIYGDIAIICSNASLYRGVMRNVFDRYGIPLFVSERTVISAYEPMRLIACAYDTVCGGFKYGDVISLLKCSLSGVAPDMCDKFELYCETWGIDGRDFFSEFRMNPAGFDRHISDYDKEVLRDAEVTRRQLMTSLKPLTGMMQGEAAGREHTQALYDYLVSLGTEQGILDRARLLAEAGDKDTAACYSVMWQMICDTLDRIDGAIGKQVLDMGTYRDVVSMSFGTVDIGRIPPTADDVTMGSAAQIRVSGKKHIYLFGVNDGELPGRLSTPAGFDDGERGKLKSLGIELADREEMRLPRELYSFYRALRSASQSLTMIHFDCDMSRSRTAPADVLGKVELLLSDVGRTDTSSLPISERIYHPRAAAEMWNTYSTTEIGASLRQALADFPEYTEKLQRAEQSIKNRRCSMSSKGTESCYGDSMRLSQSKIEKYVRCPFSYFGQYVLNLRENRRASFEVNDIGTFMHSMLEVYLKRAKESKEDMTSGECIRQVVDETADEYIRSISGEYTHRGQTLHLINRLKKFAVLFIENICREFEKSDFTPAFFELNLSKSGMNGQKPPVFELEDGTTVTLSGIIDRVDTLSDGENAYIRVVDYKTGTKEFNEEGVKRGENLQLLLYLAALLDSEGDLKAALGATENGRLYPAGILYVGCYTEGVGTAVPPGSGEAANELIMGKLVRSGVFLCDRHILDAMCHDGDKSILPIKRGETNLKEHEEWQELFEAMRRAVTDVATEIKKGRVDALPMLNGRSTACSYCAYKPICRNAVV